jgi:hypothetical protein
VELPIDAERWACLATIVQVIFAKLLNDDMLHLGDMAKMQQLTCDEKTRKILQQRASSQTESHRNVFRARIILGCLDGRGVLELALALKTRPNTVIKWRDRFAVLQLEGLEDQARPAAPRRLQGNRAMRAFRRSARTGSHR